MREKTEKPRRSPATVRRRVCAPEVKVTVMSDAIVILNAGSSSIKFSLFEGLQRPDLKGPICDGEFGGIGQHVHFVARDDLEYL